MSVILSRSKYKRFLENNCCDCVNFTSDYEDDNSMGCRIQGKMVRCTTVVENDLPQEVNPITHKCDMFCKECDLSHL